MSAQPSDLLHCSFCEKSAADVKKLIAGPGVYICNTCVDLCNEILVDDDPTTDLATLARLSAQLDQLVEQLRDDGVPWDEISQALRPDTED